MTNQSTNNDLPHIFLTFLAQITILGGEKLSLHFLCTINCYITMVCVGSARSSGCDGIIS